MILKKIIKTKNKQKTNSTKKQSQNVQTQQTTNKKQKTNKHKTKLTQAPRTRLFVLLFFCSSKSWPWNQVFCKNPRKKTKNKQKINKKETEKKQKRNKKETKNKQTINKNNTARNGGKDGLWPGFLFLYLFCFFLNMFNDFQSLMGLDNHNFISFTFVTFLWPLWIVFLPVGVVPLPLMKVFYHIPCERGHPRARVGPIIGPYPRASLGLG